MEAQGSLSRVKFEFFFFFFFEDLCEDGGEAGGGWVVVVICRSAVILPGQGPGKKGRRKAGIEKESV